MYSSNVSSVCGLSSAKTGLQSSNDTVCQRFPKDVVIGFVRAEARFITHDVGECKEVTQQPPAPDGINKTGNSCISQSTTEERILVYNQHVIVKDTIRACQKVPNSCARLPHTVTYYPGTKYSKSVDVGVCGGACQEGFACKSVMNATEAIRSPNGVRSIPVIKQCSCVKPYCYRATHFEAFLEQYADGKGKMATRTKLVDMGKCVYEDSCPSYKNRDGPRRDPASWPPRFWPDTLCESEKKKYHTFISSGGRHMNISTIETCHCES